MLTLPQHTSDDADALDKGTHVPLSYQKQCVLDAAHRMRHGLLLYPVIWAMLVQADHYASRHPRFVLLNGLALTVCAFLRLVYNRRLAVAVEQDFARANRVFRAMSLLFSAYWGTLCALVLAAPDAGTLRWLMLVSTVGITAGGTVIMAIDAVLPLLYPLCTLGPTALIVMWQGGTANMAIAGLCAIFFTYSLGISRMVREEYWARQRSQAMLEQRAQELETLSRTDALTQLPNRLQFQEALGLAWRDARRRREPLAIAMLDLDYFKQINDTHGHPFGDLCLQAAARALQGGLRRPGDLVARYGGEEFVVLLPHTDAVGAKQVAQAMLDAIQQTFVARDASSVLLSCSVGVAAGRPGVAGLNDAQALVQQADAALYQAKRAGRGRVMVHAPHSAGQAATRDGLTLAA